MRGEDRGAKEHQQKIVETPPHARGRQEPRGGIQNVPGNTPACAGKTCVTHNSRDELRKHPRMRGEDACRPKGCRKIVETPPHARGRLFSPVYFSMIFRNTPACAGKTGNFRTCRAELWKHPRMRGEDHRHRTAGAFALETPPHARGRHPLVFHSSSSIGNTPACAGKTRSLL